MIKKEMRKKKIVKKLAAEGVTFVENDFSLVLFGMVKNWEKKIEMGALAAKLSKKPVANYLISLEGEPEGLVSPQCLRPLEKNEFYDVVVIGGGVIGTSVLRELARWNLKTLLLEKEADLCFHASGRNDGMIHPGFAAKPGTKKAYYNVRGNALYSQLTEELKVPFVRKGSMILLANFLYRLAVPYLLKRAKANNVPGCCYLSSKEVKKREPHLKDKNAGAFFMPTAGQLSPQKLVCALGENAVKNGATVLFETAALDFAFEGNSIKKIITNRGEISTRFVINAAGAWSDIVAAKAGDPFFTLHFRKGEDIILDKIARKFINKIYAMPRLSQLKSKSKGGGLVPTVEGNILVGPTAHEVASRDDYSTQRGDVNELNKHIALNQKLSPQQTITYFAGIRSCSYHEDFIVQPSSKIKNLFHLAAIQSPGLASAPALAQEAVQWAVEFLSQEKKVEPNEHFNPLREDKRYDFDRMNEEEKDQFLQENPLYGKVVCRCEEVSEGEIRDVLRGPLAPTTLDGIRHRARCMTGRCHGGFCTPRVVSIMMDELNLKTTEIFKRNRRSPLFFGETKEEL